MACLEIGGIVPDDGKVLPVVSNLNSGSRKKINHLSNARFTWNTCWKCKMLSKEICRRCWQKNRSHHLIEIKKCSFEYLWTRDLLLWIIPRRGEKWSCKKSEDAPMQCPFYLEHMMETFEGNVK